MHYAQRIKDLREDRDLTQEKVAQVLQTSRSYYGRYERGLHPMTADQIKTLCQYYNVTADYLLGLIDEPIPLNKCTKCK